MFMRALIAALGMLTVAACGGSPESPGAPAGTGAQPATPPAVAAPSAAAPAANAPAAEPGIAVGFDVGEIKTAAAYLAEPRFAAADLKRGELLSLACQACHTLREGQGRLIGPNLYGIFGRRAGTVPGFDYSEALAGTDLVWTPRALEAWLAEPQRFIVGNSMAFSGFRSENDRRDVIAFLLGATSAVNVE
jgi:cytochrome c